MLIRHLVLHIEVLTNLIEDGFDLGIRFGNRLNEGIVARKLMNPFKEGLYVSKSYVAQYGIPKTPKALAGHKLIGYRFISSNRIEPLVLDIDGQDTVLDMGMPLFVTTRKSSLMPLAKAWTSGVFLKPVCNFSPTKLNLSPCCKNTGVNPPRFICIIYNTVKRRKKSRCSLNFC
ncbi:LysR family transcriptional regulator [Aggregatibacter actinomycetemcomitans serotype b str. SCC4092]|uniref:LysR family transcriptional regulator n=1 Tax=Aggregatibacter actinomycetemcomitans TaxID=714 RepID=UPI0002ABD4FE|nr:LysR family transcriptional regulator [Aggregatibacter actinomycetemcomitans]KND84482.1 LysR family transcriptional regulator [Aggregatibacter actinomycetemcomitans serotype b str. SCC1398]KOE55383.1 LysR family transcriptional regulator [Aggregatibacter actinomycetemcomitans serotype b str. SCC4092]